MSLLGSAISIKYLPLDISKEIVKKCFADEEKPASIKLKFFNGEKKPYKTAFILYKSFNAVQKAINLYHNQVLDGNRLEVTQLTDEEITIIFKSKKKSPKRKSNNVKYSKTIQDLIDHTKKLLEKEGIVYNMPPISS